MNTWLLIAIISEYFFKSKWIPVRAGVRREEKRAKRACRFATLSLKREIIPGDVGTDDSDSDDEEENDYVQALRLEGGGRGGMI